MSRRVPLLSLVLVLLAACAATSEQATPARAEAITCNVAYRGNAGGPIEREEMVTLADENGEGSFAFGELEFRAFYSAGIPDNERTLRVTVAPPGREASISTHLYQLQVDSGPVNQFVGGHGFTGLNYVYSENGAEVQFWCTAD
jgi:hypothetical protein